MIWPTAADFSQILQTPEVAFRDPVLRGSQIERNKLNQPRPWAGQFAVVFKAIRPHGQGPIAVRAFTSPSPERRERYELVTAYLESQKLDCLARFEYREEGIRVPKGWYPLVLMEWIEGVTLFQWIAAQCRGGKTETLAKAAEDWAKLVDQLKAAGIAHGDMQHGNVMVTEANRLKLVDYDGMCVPALVGRRNLEVGIEPYQHRERGGETLLGPGLDDFSALLIYVALRALAAEPGLWRKFVDDPQYDKLLFRRDDFEAGQAAPLYQDLCRSSDREVRHLAAQLFAAARGRMDQVPALGQVRQGSPEKKQAERLSRLLAALSMEDRPLFLEWFDADSIRSHADLFAPHRVLLTAWTRELLCDHKSFALAPAVARASLWREDRSPAAACARWCWPPSRFVTRCRLAFCAAEPGAAAGPTEIETHDVLTIDRRAMEREGGYLSLRVEPSWAADYLAVWAEIDLGFQVFHGRPLLLGRLDDCPRIALRRDGLFSRLRRVLGARPVSPRGRRAEVGPGEGPGVRADSIPSVPPDAAPAPQPPSSPPSSPPPSPPPPPPSPAEAPS